MGIINAPIEGLTYVVRSQDWQGLAKFVDGRWIPGHESPLAFSEEHEYVLIEVALNSDWMFKGLKDLALINNRVNWKRAIPAPFDRTVADLFGRLMSFIND